MAFRLVETRSDPVLTVLAFQIISLPTSAPLEPPQLNVMGAIIDARRSDMMPSGPTWRDLDSGMAEAQPHEGGGASKNVDPATRGAGGRMAVLRQGKSHRRVTDFCEGVAANDSELSRGRVCTSMDICGSGKDNAASDGTDGTPHYIGIDSTGIHIQRAVRV
ncbi:hypothetical protein BV25DRAFT_1840159 [Artomyces pyxidatus]|uniref:Uncharacterized protein n=1 Tax=Artomyces pyxidatus TaxID=48021 RepID=A0ACB8SU80_9AGAM|nr:hypothetical protein BV25DRAFT_1840159 [Artomyces pyxidatus]